MKKDVDKKLCDLIVFFCSKDLLDVNAHHYRINGVFYRLGLLRRSFEIFFDSLEKLPNNDWECETVNVGLNSVYLHLRGILDNLAWIVYYELHLQNLNPPRDIDLIGNKFRKILRNESHIDLEKIISAKEKWLNELKDKRDPISHRLPLYIPAKFITSAEDLDEALELKRIAKNKMKKGDLSFVKEENASMHIGNFKPVIINLDVENKTWKNYPILPEIEKDIENFSDLCKEIYNYIIQQDSLAK